jgi:hypothetical protein
LQITHFIIDEESNWNNFRAQQQAASPGRGTDSDGMGKKALKDQGALRWEGKKMASR